MAVLKFYDLLLSSDTMGLNCDFDTFYSANKNPLAEVNVKSNWTIRIFQPSDFRIV